MLLFFMSDFLTIATIVKPQGIRGEVKVLALTDTPEDLQGFSKVSIGGKPYRILKVRPQPGNCAFLTLSGVADRNTAELLRGESITVDREDAPALPDDRVYITDVIGCGVVDEKGVILGEVTEITPARTDVYEVAKPNGRRLIFPAVDGVILRIDVDGKRVEVDSKKLAEVALDEA